MSDKGGASSPAAPSKELGFPENAGLYVFEEFTTLNTKALRPGIKDPEMSWCDGFMPIGPNNLRTLYGVGPSLYTAPGGLTIPFFGFGNIGATPYCVVLLSDGSIQGVNTNTGGVTEIAPPGSIVNPSPLIGLSQWSNQYILIVANQSNGYLTWDGTTLNTYDIAGTAVETYSGHVWIANGPVITFSAPGSVSDFATSDGGGSFISNDSFLNIGFTFLKQSNGFLYLGADSALNYISGVNTAPNPSDVPTTTFQNQNVDPQIGTPYPGTLQVFSRNLIFGNSLGIYVSYGGAVTKISEPLDGIYNTVPNFANFNLSSAVANIFGIEVYMQLTPVIDTYTGQQTNKLLMWSGKAWFTSQQNVALTYIASQKINSVLTAWGTTGSVIYPLFQQPSTAIQKVAQSKLWSTPHYLYTKTATRLYGVLNYYQNDNEPVDVTIDNELTSTPYTSPFVGNGIAWTNNSGQTINWTNNSSQPILWVIAGITVFGPVAVAQNGRMIGMTVVTFASDVSVISTTVMNQTYQANV